MARESLLLRLPARWMLPLLLSLFALLMTGLGHLTRLRELDSEVLRAEQQRLRERLAIEQTRIAIAHGRGEMAQVRRLVSGLALHEGLTQAWLLDDTGRIEGSISRAEIGRLISTVLIAQPPKERHLLLELQRHHLGELRLETLTEVTGEPQMLVGAVGIDPDLTLLTQVDLGHALGIRHAQARADLVRQSLATLAGVMLLGVLLHLLWFRRAEWLRRTASALGRGDLGARAALQGADELALIGRAVDMMASDLQQRQAELQHLADLIAHSPLVVMTWRNAEGWPVRYVSDNVSQWGYRRADFLMGRLIYADLIHPDDRPRITRDVAEHLARGPDEYRQEYRLRHADGRWLWLDDRTWLVRDAQGVVTDIHGVLLDVTERHAVQQALAEQVQRLREAESHARLGSWTFDVASSRGWWSEQMYQLLDFDPAEGVPSFEDYVEQVHPQDRGLVMDMLRSFAQGVLPASRMSHFRSDPRRGPLRWFSVSIHAERDPSGRIIRFVGTQLDVTAVHEAEDALRQLNADLERRVDLRTRELSELNQSLESFVYTVSHDLKAPLRGIEGYSRLLIQDHGPQLEGEAREFVGLIRDGVVRMGALIEDLLAYARTERRALSVQTVDLPRAIEGVCADAAAELAAGRVELQVEVPALQVCADAEGLTLVLRNLLSNAVKFSAKSQPPRVRIRARVPEDDQDQVEISVEDNGVGFDMDYHDRIFEIFQRLHRMEDYPGTGIGLALVRKAMQRMGGSVRAISAPGQGATFVLRLPLSRPSARDAA
ncbi:PAS domain-containing protein [Sphaerotilus uruguayifluvii]|uniref:histidine kinase n=1 Tax=Sphaerotilus uruguayifluvii TaxID=2735897 RepID=A0ABX2G5M7_9BURK|nr:PAS domain-containing protein [Leptothrix sp. C29]NRT57589.1 PAS domain S-box-containing protein [Leptothrix sp. C29]